MKVREVLVGIAGIIILLGMIMFYQKNYFIEEIQEPVLLGTEPEENIIEGYTEAEDVVAYVLKQIQEENLERALRGCALDLSENFFMTNYLQYTEDYKGIKMIPPADNDDSAYVEISRMCLAYDYATMIQKCISVMEKEDTLKIYDIKVEEPENPDGKYYERMNTIKEILGARDVCEMVAYVEVQQVPTEFRFSLVRYRKYWKVLLFNTLENYENGEPDIRESKEKFDKDKELWDKTDLDHVLPMNYDLIIPQSEENPDELVEKFLIYLQRGDILSAMTFFDYGGEGGEPLFSYDLLKKEREIAVDFQELYYEMFLFNENEVAWAKRHFEDEPEFIPENLKVSNIIYGTCNIPKKIEESETMIKYEISFRYKKMYFPYILTLEKENSWRIVNIE